MLVSCSSVAGESSLIRRYGSSGELSATPRAAGSGAARPTLRATRVPCEASRTARSGGASSASSVSALSCTTSAAAARASGLSTWRPPRATPTCVITPRLGRSRLRREGSSAPRACETGSLASVASNSADSAGVSPPLADPSATTTASPRTPARLAAARRACDLYASGWPQDAAAKLAGRGTPTSARPGRGHRAWTGPTPAPGSLIAGPTGGRGPIAMIDPESRVRTAPP